LFASFKDKFLGVCTIVAKHFPINVLDTCMILRVV